tara:strand:- start:11800 stop:12972 length:1173 start_codon:yes stop_codon:yes gene_type:complete
MKKILFLTNDGILEPLGYSQIISYLIKLSKNYSITIISLEKVIDLNDFENYEYIKKKLDENNISWKFLKYNYGIFKYLNFIKLLLYTIFIILKNNIKIVHTRSYIPALIVLFIKLVIKIEYIFDMRGFWIDERIDWKIWNKKSLKYIFFKYFEKKIINKSLSIVSLTNHAVIELKLKYLNSNSNIKTYVIPTSVNITTQNIKKNKNKNIILSHLGAIGTRYNFETYLKIYKSLSKNENYFLSIINKNEHNKITYFLNKYNIGEKNYTIKYIKPYEVKKSLLNVDFGVFFPVEGKYLKAYFPTKLGEFLSSGIPVITNKINDDVDSIIHDNNVGIIIDDINNINYDKLNKDLINMLKDKNLNYRCTNVAKKYFDLDKAVNIYKKVYDDCFI